MLETLWRDVRYAVRGLRRTPGFTVAAVLTLALGIGLTITVYSVIDAVLVQPIPFANDERLVMVWETDRDTGTTREPASFPDFVDFRERATQLDRLGAFIAGEMNLIPERGDPIRVARLSVTADFLSMLGITPLLGRGVTEADDRPGSPAVVLISEQLWETLYQSDPAVMDRTINLNGRPHAVIGVLPRSAGFGAPQILNTAAYSRGFAARDPRAEVDVWIPLRGNAATMLRENHPLMMLGRLRSGATVQSAQDDLALIAADLERAFPSNQARGVFVERFRDVVIGPVQPALLVVMTAVILLLLIACVNVANLLLARASSRTREIAVRSAIGAGIGQLSRQFIIESAVLTFTAAVAGVALAVAGLRLLLALAPPQIPRLADVSLDLRVLLMAVAVSVAIAVVFGLAPLLQARRGDLQSALRAGDASGDTGDCRARRRRAALVATEVALAVALVTTAGLLLRSVGELHAVDPGFDATDVIKAEFQLPPGRYPVDIREYPNIRATHRFNETLLARLAALPGVEAVGLAGNQPLDVGFTNSFVIVGREAEAGDWPEISIRRVTPGYFDTLRVRLLSGRFIDDRDATSAPAVALVNQAAADRFFANRDPIGHEIAFWGASRRIVGVVANEKFHGVALPAPIAVYVPLPQAPSIDGTQALLVRASGDVRSSVRSIIRDIDPALAVFAIEPLDETLENSIRQQQFLMQLLGLFAVIALALAAVGIHGVLSHTLAQRRREIGVRIALGATVRDVMRLMLGQSLRVSAFGLATGIALGLALSQWLRSWLYGISPVDPITLLGVLIVLSSVAAVSSYVPTRRAARVDPAAALRAD